VKANVPARIGRDAIRASLDEDALLQQRIADLCGQCFGGNRVSKKPYDGPQLLPINRSAVDAGTTSAYWDANGSSALWELMRPCVDAGGQPVFAAVSLMVRSTDPTVVVPVPLRSARSARGFSTSLWVNADDGDRAQFKPSLTELREAVRAVSHALTNISYSVRIDDDPAVGWLARSHATSTAFYFPDVSSVDEAQGGDVYSAARREERHLAMASVLYIPLLKPKARGGHSRAVLMLWSPVPHRWDDCFRIATPNESAPNVIEVGDFREPSLRKRICVYFHWLEHVIARDESSQHRSELQVLNFILLLVNWQARQHGDVRAAVDELLHRSKLQVEHLSGSRPPGTTSIGDWFYDILFSGNGFLNTLKQEWHRLGHRTYDELGSLPVRIKVYGETKLRRAWNELENRPDIFSDVVPASARVPFDRTTAEFIGTEAVDNIAKYASRLNSISINVSRRFATVRFTEIPRKGDIARLIGSDESFSRYYAVRRGLAVAPRGANNMDEIGYGLGFLLYRVFAYRTKVFRKFYISPDGEHCHTDLVLPLDRKDLDDAY
jgi:hypothetical protein